MKKPENVKNWIAGGLFKKMRNFFGMRKNNGKVFGVGWRESGIGLLILLFLGGDWSSTEEWKFLIDQVLDILEVSGDGLEMGVDGVLVGFVDLWNREGSEESENGKSASGEPRGDVGQRPEDETELDRLQWALDEDQLLELVGDAGGVLGEHIGLSVNLLLWEGEVVGEDLREWVLSVGLLDLGLDLLVGAESSGGSKSKKK